MEKENILKQFKIDFDEIVKNHKGRIVISSHINPDDDSISSVLSLYTYFKDLKQISNAVEIYYSNKKVDRWEKFKYFEKINFVEDISQILNKEDLLIILDCQGYYRISNFPEKIIELNIATVVIDHHKTTPDRDYTLTLCYPKIFASSNAEIMYCVFYKQELGLQTNVAEVLLFGIYGDTGNFRFITSESVDVFIFAKEIIQKGNVKVDNLQSKLENSHKKVYELLGKMLINQKVFTVEKWGKFTTSVLSIKETNSYLKEDVSSAKGIYGVHYSKSVKGTGWGLLITPNLTNTREWNVSCRSQPGFPNVRFIAQALDEVGGGHDAAAGATLREEKYGRLDEDRALQIILDYLKSHKPKIIPL